MSSEFDEQYDQFRGLIDSKTPEEAVKMLAMFGVKDALIQQIRDRHETEAIEIRESENADSVVLGNRWTWYTGPQPADKCWPGLKKQLEAKHWPDSSIDALDRSSTQIVSLLNHPREKQFSTRGLVVGHVQSGKTTNFTAVMAKAADRNYKLFIVLAGVHNSLRRQTQLRLVQDLIAPNATKWMQLTIPEKDFVAPANAAAYFAKNNKQHVLCVIKKNAAVLRRFRKWLDSASDYLQDCPAIIIDDEADQATVATKTINPLVRDIIDRLPRSAYIGYTATPFANLLIDPSAKDLYPEDFIVSLPKPEGHFGTEVLFGRELLDGEEPDAADDGYDMIRTIPVDEIDRVRPRSAAERDQFEPDITGELKDAIYYFWLSTAARRLRQEAEQHATMLVHTSVNTAIHESFKAPIEALQSTTLVKLRAGDASTVEDLRDLWDREAGKVDAAEFGHSQIQFSQIEEHLQQVLEDNVVILDNASSKVRLNYEGPPVTAIAVGGNTLSRGLTLEGLSVSYFVRSVSAYDTLLQMGRWFGYRTGYEDLPRVWMTSELRDWFRHLATVESEIRRDIGIYMVENETPRSFAVRIRTHPSLRVTAAAKMDSAVKAFASYGGRRIQTRYFDLDRELLLRNQDAAKSLISAADSSGNRFGNEYSGRKNGVPGRQLLVWRDVPFEEVLTFLSNYQFHEKSQDCNAALLSKYIDKRVAAGSLLQWNVAVVGKHGSADDEFTLGEQLKIGKVKRSSILKSAVPDIKTLMSRRDAAVDLHVSDLTGELTEERIFNLRQKSAPDVGLIVVYVIDKVSAPTGRQTDTRVPLDAPEDVIGVGLVFPAPKGKDSEVEWDYVSADLSGIDIEEDDLSALEFEEL
ncbi:endonuclease [Rhodococcus sp. 06-412-2C]|uniref:Z1 domain-containing protein n=1 Tax=unclassified Rhodococcus (in: high G+C Gram-positive bacteria) TaxID=192944 RepID=UPI000B9B6B8D|nr:MULTISPECIES: Z1 domain-containing protein [unclassified Rhodococcus (in: high G+C Gram-positive bacteria)]OZC89854.1 endonuclease [Rhodococcus sp. 06-412-2C]OZC93317.1 endonuclease [Rhodococcus sp. 06-412-2B]